MSTSREFELGDGGGEADLKAVVRKPVGVENNSAAARLGMSRMASDHPQQGFQSVRNGATTRPGVGRPPWMVGRPVGDSGSEDNVSTETMDSSLKKEEAPSTSTWDRPAPTNRSHEDSALLRKAAFMYGSPLQARRVAVARANSEGAHPQSSGERGAGTSPLPFYNRIKGARRFENGMQSPEPQRQRPNVTAPAGSKRPGTAQLTVFYAGMVNVYDDVPFDKAQAIMLLAGTGNAWPSSNYTNIVGGANRGSRPFVTPAGGLSRACFPAPQSSTPASSSGAPAKLPDRQVPKAAVELPQARKASLARFLEKRKDRVRKGPYTHPNDDDAKSEAMRNSRENSPSNISESSGCKPALSPTRNESNNNGNESKNYGSESTSSQPATPPRPSTSGSEKLQHFEVSAHVEKPVSPSR